jgi:predicted RNase H-like HicB family nuclease
MQFNFTVLLTKNSDTGYSAKALEFEHLEVKGRSQNEALAKMQVLLDMTVKKAISNRKEVPKKLKTASLNSIAVDVPDSEKYIDYVSSNEAASLLGVSQGRISALVSSGQLEGYHDSKFRLRVSLDSIEARLAQKPRRGRPKKV